MLSQMKNFIFAKTNNLMYAKRLFAIINKSHTLEKA